MKRQPKHLPGGGGGGEAESGRRFAISPSSAASSSPPSLLRRRKARSAAEGEAGPRWPPWRWAGAPAASKEQQLRLPSPSLDLLPVSEAVGGPKQPAGLLKASLSLSPCADRRKDGDGRAGWLGGCQAGELGEPSGAEEGIE